MYSTNGSFEWDSIGKESDTRWLGYVINETEQNDYTVLVTAFISLGLLLFTEMIRRGLDRAAHGHKIAETVLEVVYREREFYKASVTCRITNCRL